MKKEYSYKTAYSDNVFIKNDYIEENFAHVDHAFLDIFSTDIKTKLLDVLLAYESCLDKYDTMDKYEKDCNTQTLQFRQWTNERDTLKRKVLKIIKEIKTTTNNPKWLQWVPTITTSLVTAVYATIGHALFKNGTLEGIYKSLNSLSQSAAQSPICFNTTATFNADLNFNNQTYTPNPKGLATIHTFLRNGWSIKENK